MSCRRAYDVDLAEFLAEPRAAGFEAFRDHYPRCRECSAEVRAWTELRMLLGVGGADAHPGPEDLLRFADGALPASQRATLQGHLQGCASCRDELAALDGYDPVAAPAALRPERRPFLEGLRRLLLQPAFAYAVALLVAAPTLYDLVSPGGPAATPAPAEPQSSALEASRDIPAADERLEADAPMLELERVRPKQEAADRVAAVKKSEAPPAEARQRPARRAPEAKSAPLDRGDRETASPLDLAAESESAPVAESFADSAAAEGGRLQATEFRAQKRGDEALRALGYGEPGPQPFERRPDGSGVVRVPLPSGLGASEVHLTSPDGSRTLVERVPDGTKAVLIEIPAAWLEPGVWRIERRTGGRSSTMAVTVPEAR